MRANHGPDRRSVLLHLLVSGALTRDGRVDRKRMQALLEAARPLPFTFHRAFDVSRNQDLDLEILIQLGVQRVLTSGGAPTVPQGLTRLAELLKLANNRITILPGGGLNPDNIATVVATLGVKEFHASASKTAVSRMTHRNTAVPMSGPLFPPEYEWKECDADKVNAMLLSSRHR